MLKTTQITPLFLKPIFHDKMWGGTKLKDFNFKISGNNVGEAWLASTYGNDLSVITNGEFKGQTLKSVWENNKYLFANANNNQTFPLLVKILDAKENLSIQVHPDDKNAQKYFNEPNGKTECWYILDAVPGAIAYYGHTATNSKEMKNAIANHKLSNILKTIKVKAGDMIYVPSGTLHALGAGIVALEIEQSSDNTLRFYDFDRVSKVTGKKRPLQVDKAIAVTNFPNVTPDKNITKIIPDPKIKSKQSILRTNFFNVADLNIENNLKINNNSQYSINVVINGHGNLKCGQQKYDLNRGDTFIIPSPLTNYEITGPLKIIQVTTNEK